MFAFGAKPDRVASLTDRVTRGGGGGGGYPPLSRPPEVLPQIGDHQWTPTAWRSKKTNTTFWRAFGGVFVMHSAEAFGRAIQKMLRCSVLSSDEPLSGVRPHTQVRRVYEGKGKAKVGKAGLVKSGRTVLKSCSEPPLPGLDW